MLDEKRKVILLNSPGQEIFGEPYISLIHKSVETLIPELSASGETVKTESHNLPVSIGGKKYLATWKFFSGNAKGSSVLTLKSVEAMRTLYARYGNERTRKGELKYSFEDMLGSSAEMKALKKKAERFAGTDFPVLIQGESGTGKELLAQAIHQASERKKGPFVAFNCAALSDSLLESELFGYNEGAFTGAAKKGRAGFFEMASGGTLFIDEIGDISLNMQSKILRVLQEQEVVRVGGSQPIPVDVRIISATNQDLQQLVRDKRFRLDLYYRMNTLVLQTVPLRERPHDIYDLLPEFLKKNHIKKNIRAEAMEFMLSYSWPGNVRELQNCISYLSIVENDMIGVEDFPEYMRPLGKEKTLPKNPFGDGVPAEKLVLVELERCRKAGEKTGRKRLAECMKKQGTPISEAEIRILLERLQEEGLIEIRKGRGGTRITGKGAASINEYFHGEADI